MNRKSGRWNPGWRGHPGSSTSYEYDRIERQPLPSSIKCGQCEKVKPCTETHFSKKQLWCVKEHIISYGPAGLMSVVKFTCRFCSPQAVVELDCSSCNTSKGLEDFSKQQRRTPDSATCKKCMTKLMSLRAGEGEKSEDGSTDEDEDEHEKLRRVEGSHVGTDTMSVTSSFASSGGVPIPRAEHGWVEVQPKGLAYATTTKQFDPRAYGRSNATSTSQNNRSNPAKTRSVRGSSSAAPRPSSVAGPSRSSIWGKPYNPNNFAEVKDLDDPEGSNGSVEADEDYEQGFAAKNKEISVSYSDSSDDYE